ALRPGGDAGRRVHHYRPVLPGEAAAAASGTLRRRGGRGTLPAPAALAGGARGRRADRHGMGRRQRRPIARDESAGADKEVKGMRWSFDVAKVAGITVRLHVTFLLLLLWLAVSHSPRGGSAAVVQLLAVILGIAVSVVLHAFGVALTAD